MALLDRLENDQNLSVFAGQFVPLKLVTNGQTEDWRTWSRRYRHDGNTIPILYVIRADGEKLYARSGMLGGDALPEMLITTLQQAGRIFSNQETELLQYCVESAEKALSGKNHVAAARHIAEISKIGVVGNLESFSDLAIRADEIVKQLSEIAESLLAEATLQLDDEATAFPGALTLVELDDAYDKFPSLKKPISEAMRNARKNKQLREHFKPAESLTKARKLAMPDDEKSRKRAESAYKAVVSRYPDSPAHQLALEELKNINPELAATLAPASADANLSDRPPKESDSNNDSNNEGTSEELTALRVWTDRSGKYQIKAKFVEIKSGKVYLEKEDGSVINLPIGRLSKDDQALVKKN